MSITLATERPDQSEKGSLTGAAAARRGCGEAVATFPELAREAGPPLQVGVHGALVQAGRVRVLERAVTRGERARRAYADQARLGRVRAERCDHLRDATQDVVVA